MNVQLSPTVDASRLESTRYALIRRLGGVFGHQLVVNLQPLSIIFQVMEHRLSATPPNMDAIRENVEHARRLLRDSVDSCQDVLSWLAADEQTFVSASVVVGECISKLRSSLSFRSFAIQYGQSSLDIPVRQVAVREVLTAALIALSDQAKGLDEIVVTLLGLPNAVEIAIQLRKGANESSAEKNAYRVLKWSDVQLLATTHGVQFCRDSDELIKICVAQTVEAPP